MARLKTGMVGGELDAMVGAWHRRAAAIDGGIELVAGALTATCERALATELELDFPNAEDGVRGLAFVAAAMDRDVSDAKWTAMKDYLS